LQHFLASHASNRLEWRQKSDLRVVLFIGVLIPTRRRLDILTNLSPTQLQIIADKKESQKGINSVSTESANGYELGFGSGNPHIGSDRELSG
jgi:hypothetical protein